jgi:arabinose-5-phosphate isomerase
MISESGTRFIISERATIDEALVAITENKHGAAVVADVNHTLVGVVSDGDIRRAIVRGATTLAPVTKCVNMNPLTVRKSADVARESRRIFSDHPEVTLIPIVGEHNRVLGVIARPPE